MSKRDENGIQIGLLRAWYECADTRFACETERERHIVGGCMNRILALMGRDPETDPHRVRFEEGRAIFPRAANG